MYLSRSVYQPQDGFFQAYTNTHALVGPANRLVPSSQVDKDDREFGLRRWEFDTYGCGRILCDLFSRHVRAPSRAARGTPWPHWQQGGPEDQTPVPPLLVSSME